jgi:hypothetical protein
MHRSSDVLGLIEFLKKGQYALEHGLPYPVEPVKVSAAPAIAEPGRCPKCSREGPFQKLPGASGVRCAQCGHQWFLEGTRPPTIAGPTSRGDLQKQENFPGGWR